jgi:DNA-binding GntR family transcriptional regulator
MWIVTPSSGSASSGSAAHERLRRAIVRLELPPAAPVSEQQLAERFGLSKAAVRAALARLRAEGLVLSEPRRGHLVAPLTLRDVREIYDLRLLVEPPAAAAAAGRLPPADLDRLVRRVDTLLEPAALEQFLDTNRAVHVAIAGAAGNRRLAALVQRLLDESERVIAVALLAGAAGGGLRVREEHRALLDALRAGDADGARRAMSTAIQQFRHELLAVLGATGPVLDAGLVTLGGTGRAPASVDPGP